MKKVKNSSTYSLKWKCDLCTMYDYCNLGHFIWLNPSPSEVPTSGDLKSGDCLFCSTTNIKHRCPHNRKWTQWPQIMTWVWLRTLSEVSHKLQTVKINKIVLAASDENTMFKNATESILWLKKKIWILEELKSKLKHWKAQNSILPRKFGDLYGRPGDLCCIKNAGDSAYKPTDFHWFNFFYLDSFCLVYKKICLLICPFLLINI